MTLIQQYIPRPLQHCRHDPNTTPLHPQSLISLESDFVRHLRGDLVGWKQIEYSNKDCICMHTDCFTEIKLLAVLPIICCLFYWISRYHLQTSTTWVIEIKIVIIKLHNIIWNTADFTYPDYMKVALRSEMWSRSQPTVLSISPMHSNGTT